MTYRQGAENDARLGKFRMRSKRLPSRETGIAAKLLMRIADERELGGVLDGCEDRLQLDRAEVLDFVGDDVAVGKGGAVLAKRAELCDLGDSE